MESANTSIVRADNLPAIPYEVRRYITVQRALGTPCPTIEADVLERYKVEVRRQDIYDHSPSYNKDMPKALVELYKDVQKNLADSMECIGIANKGRRILQKDKRYEKLLEIVERRAFHAQENGSDTDLAMGMGTGLVTKMRQNIGGDEVEEVYKIATDIIGALEDLETSTAKELGQLKEGSGITIQKAIIGVNLDQV